MSLSLWAEPSVYGFDDEYIEDSPNIAVEDNRHHKDISGVVDEGVIDKSSNYTNTTTTIEALKEQVDEQSERIDGLITIIDGLSKSLKEIRQSSKVSSSYDIPIEDIKEDEVVEADANVKVDNITSVEPIVYDTSVKPETKPEVKSNNLIFSEGVTSFLNKEYTKAKERFTLTDSKGYKVGTSNYYLGEIYYYTKDYKSAIFHYKKSAGVDDKASYMDTLLLHTGISFENSGKKEKAKAFYQNIIANYPKNKTAKIAKDKLRNM